MSAFIEERINDKLIIFGTQGGPSWKTAIVQTNSGREQRNSVWMYPISSYQFVERLTGEAEAKYLNNWFNTCQGMGTGFRFKDWLDWQDDGRGIINMNGYGSTLATGQMFKKYGVASATSLRKISKPVDGSVKVYIDGVYAPSATVDSTTGVVGLPLLTVAILGATPGGTTDAILSVPAHPYMAGDQASFLFTGGSWPSANGLHNISVIDTNTISISVDASLFGVMTVGNINSYPQARNVLTWTGAFDVPVRFDTDSLQLTFSSAQMISPGYDGVEAILGDKAFDLQMLNMVELKL